MRPLAPLDAGTGILLLTLVLALGACDAAFEPLTGSETEFFAVYGFLDTESDTQFVRVSPLRPLLDPASQPADTRVASTVVETGERTAWQDSLVRLDDGGTGLLFYAPFRAQPGGTYRLEVRRPDDRLTQATTRVPPTPALRTDAVVRAPSTDFVQTVTWAGLTRQPAGAALRYRITFPGASQPDTVTFSFPEPGMPVPDGWAFTVNLTQDRFAILDLLDRGPTDSTVVLLGLAMEVEARSEEWQRPDAPLNIQHGFGFFGAVATFEQAWTLDATTTLRVGFAVPPSGAGRTK